MTDRRGMDLADYVRELTQPHDHREPYTIRSLTGTGWVPRHHTTHVPSLIAQLWANDTPSAAVEEGPRPGFASRPAARLEALDTAARIDIQAARWVTDIGETPRSLDTADLIRQLHGLQASADPTQRTAIARSIRGWWLQARIVTGWDSPAWSPSNTCPQCGSRGTLKIRLAEHIGMCTHQTCDATWDETTIGVLADHIRGESMAEQRLFGDVACWCPWPEPRIPDLRHQCRRCGSARCRHALAARLVADARAAAQAS